LTIINENKLPVYLRGNLEDCLKSFIKIETQNVYDNATELILDEFTSNFLVNDDELGSYWENLLKKTYKNELNDEIMNLEKNSEEIKLTKLYHKLIHSELMMIILDTVLLSLMIICLFQHQGMMLVVLMLVLFTSFQQLAELLLTVTIK